MAPSRICLVVSIAAVSFLTACGKAEEPKIAAPPSERGIFISTSDCAEAGLANFEMCGKAIDMAVAAHEQNATAYKTRRQCETVEGPERCDKSSDEQYRARLQAFFVTFSDPPTAVPLYAPAKGTAVGFRSPSKQTIEARDENLHVSATALSVAFDNSKLPTESTDAAAGLGAAAADVH